MAKKNQLTKKEGLEISDSELLNRLEKAAVISSGYSDPKNMLEEFVKTHRGADGKMVASKEFYADFMKIQAAMGLITHAPLAEAVKEEYRPLVVEIIKCLEREYDCKTASEISLAETIASAHVRKIQCSKALSAFMSRPEVDRLGVEYGRFLSKELDRAHRHYTSALAVLRQIKNPAMELNINVKNAFIAKNQQINDP